MDKRKRILFVTLVGLMLALGACSTPPTTTNNNPVANEPTAQAVPKSAATSSVASSTSSATSTAVTSIAEMGKTHENAADYTWDASKAIQIALQGNSISASGTGVTVTGTIARITAPGTFRLSGSLTDGQIIVNSTTQGTVKLILDNVDLRSSTSAPIYIMAADKTVIILADNSRNSIADAKTYALPANTNEPNAAIFAKSDLTIYGNGTLTVDGNYQDGITSKDGLIIASGTLTVKSADDGIRGKDYIVVKNGTFTINAQGDGLKSDNAEDATRGYVSIQNGTFNITSGADAIQAHTNLLVANGKFTLISGGGHSSRIAADASAKGIKAISNVKIDGGTFTIDTADDALNSNNNLIVNAGTFTISTGDDGLHADKTLVINGGTINITKSYEGIESENITINNGDIHVVSSDDGLNGAGGKDGSGTLPGPGIGGGPGGVRPGGGMPGRGGFMPTGNYHLYINGGYIAIDAKGDGIDINGSIEMTNGTVLVNGPTENMNGAIDYDAGFKLTGGFIVAVGSSGMAQAPDETSTQNSLLLNLTSAQAAGTLVRIQSADGKDLVTFKPTKTFQSIAVSSPGLVKGTTFDVYLGGGSTGTLKDSLYQGGTFSAGTKNTSFTVSGVVTRIGANSRLR